MTVTPRHFLNLIKLFHEKRRDLDEEQVKELQKSLTLKSSELEEKKSAANAKLKEMLVDQQKAEDEKKRSEQLQKELSEQLQQIATKKTEVQKDLSQVGEKG